MATLKQKIQKALANRSTNGLTVGEIYDRLDVINYDSVRGRVYELANEGKLVRGKVRRDSDSNTPATTFLLRAAVDRKASKTA